MIGERIEEPPRTQFVITKAECHKGTILPLFTPVMRNVSMRRVVAELLKYLYQGIKGDLWSVEPRQDFRS